MKSVFVFAIVLTVCVSSVFASPMADPFKTFNVYSLGSIGSSASPYGSDFQGVAGAGGNVYFGSFSLGAAGATDGVGMYVGGSVNITGGSYTNDIMAGGPVNLQNMTVYGSIHSGSNVTNTNQGGGTINGSVYAAGNVSIGQQMTVTGQKYSGTPFVSPMDYTATNNFFLNTSSTVGAMAQTTAVNNNYGNLILTGNSGVNVVDVSASTLLNAWGVTITAPADAIFYINVLDKNVTLDSTTWSYNGGIGAGNVLLNMPNATSLSLSGGNLVNLLAPLATTNFSSGVLTGNLIVGSLQGAGQVNSGDFVYGGPVPEPATACLLILGGAGMLMRRFRKA